MLQAGVTGDGGKTWALNVIPTEAHAGFDIRVPVTVPIPDIEARINQWCAAEGLSWEYAPWVGEPIKQHYVSSIDRETNPFWNTFQSCCEGMGMDVNTEIFPAGTDSRFIRGLGIPAFGFSPMTNTPILLHEHDEYLHRDVFLQGIDIYSQLIPALANQPQGEQTLKRGRAEDGPGCGHPAAAAAAAGGESNGLERPPKKTRPVVQ